VPKLGSIRAVARIDVLVMHASKGKDEDVFFAEEDIEGAGP
jgi:hypothetical protein